MAHGYRPVICKIEIKNPNKHSTKISNRNLLRYIATREGVDLSNVSTINDAINKNYDLTEKGEQAISLEAPDNEYLKYMSFRPRSHGLFGNIDTENFMEVSKKLDVISSAKRTVYRGVISLSEVDGKALGYNNTTKWNLYLNSVMPDIANVLGLSPNDITWVAAFHAEQSHPHVHFMLWNNEDKVKNAFITNSQHLACREICQNAMFTEENETIIKQITEAERKEYYAIQNTSRKKVTEYFKEVDYETVFGVEQSVPGAILESMPGRLSAEEHACLKSLYENILQTLPGKGRISYKFMPPECKAYIDQVTGLFLKRPEVKVEYQQYMNAVEQIHKSLGKTGKEIEIQCNNSIKDLYSRTGNIILKAVCEIKDSVLDSDNIENSINKDNNLDKNQKLSSLKDLQQVIGYIIKQLDKKAVQDIDIKEFEDILETANEKDLASGMLISGLLYSNRHSSNYDPNNAVYCLNHALMKECDDINKGIILLRLGMIYVDETYDNYDLEKSVSYFLEAAKLGNFSAMFKLARCYIYGIGVEKDAEAGMEWMRKSAELGCNFAKKYLVDYAKKEHRENSNMFKENNYNDFNCKGFSSVLLKQIFSSLQQTRAKEEIKLQEFEFRSLSKQARKEEYLHRN